MAGLQANCILIAFLMMTHCNNTVLKIELARRQKRYVHVYINLELDVKGSTYVCLLITDY